MNKIRTQKQIKADRELMYQNKLTRLAKTEEKEKVTRKYYYVTPAGTFNNRENARVANKIGIKRLIEQCNSDKPEFREWKQIKRDK